MFKQGRVHLKLLRDGLHSLNLTYKVGAEDEELYELAKRDFGEEE